MLREINCTITMEKRSMIDKVTNKDIRLIAR